MSRISPVVYITLGLVLLTISFLLAADLFGLTPDTRGAVLDARKKVVESLAVQLSVAAGRGDIVGIRETVRALVERNDDVLSAALRRVDGERLAVSGDHDRYWRIDPDGSSSLPNQAIVPIFRGEQRWGGVEVRFAPLYPDLFFGLELTPLVKLVLFITLAASGGFLLFMRRTLRHLDPGALLPARVKVALDALAEGVVMMDKRGSVVLANTRFLADTGRDEKQVLGTRIMEWDWRSPEDDRTAPDTPWMRALRDQRRQTGKMLRLSDNQGGFRIFSVNASPIAGDDGKIRGVLATFDDVTALEDKNRQLERALNELQVSRNEIRRQNQRLQVLATHDPLTGCLNRRAFFERLDQAVAQARRSSKPLACVMADIDHFKNVNDTWGHETGDTVIKRFADALGDKLRSSDAIGRYGGEEFCLILWDNDIEQAAASAERIRAALEAHPGRPPVTGSFGVAVLDARVKDSAALVNRADEALYAAKHGGRNRVECWEPDSTAPATERVSA
ncbi:MAG TPA: diguanylate cyclase [Gammaproteobacteria bacterium]|nr:diguanylate cyclase [Gammaproteobacteria bacterium]